MSHATRVNLNWGGNGYATYDGLLKGADTANDQLKLQNQLSQQELALQQKVLGQILGSGKAGDGGILQYMLHDIGFSPAQTANLNSQFLNNQSNDFASAGRNVKQALLQRGEGGGQNPLAGSAVNDIAALSGLQASSTSSGLRDIQLSSIQQALANRFNAAGIMMGIGGQYGNNFGSANAGASSALNSYITGINANTPMQLATGLASGLGSSLGIGIGGGIGSKIAGSCWIAEAIWGINDTRTHLVRAWLNREFADSWFMKLYVKYGQRVAKNKLAVWVLTPLFNLALRKACERNPILVTA